MLPKVEQVQAELRSALRQLAESKARPYYDDEADQAAAAAYYDGVRPDRLGELVAETHREQPRYQPARELYPWVDLQPDGVIRSLYTGQTWDPAELIAQDFHVAELRVRERARLIATARADDATVEEALERALPYNCEHVVPQSWFDKREPMRGDLHHLFACESRCNSFRGNTPYAEFADFPQPSPRASFRPTAARAKATASSRRTARARPPGRSSTSACATRDQRRRTAGAAPARPAGLARAVPIATPPSSSGRATATR